MKHTIWALRIIAGAVAMAWSLSAVAGALLCQAVFAPEVQFRPQDNGVTPKQVESFREVVNDVNSRLGKLQAPQNAEILIHSEHNAPFADQIQKSITMGIRYSRTINGKTYQKAPSLALAILAHEYGHLVFAENYLHREPLYAEGVSSLEKAKPFEKKFAELELQKTSLAAQMKTFKEAGKPTPPEIIQRHTAVSTMMARVRDQIQDIKADYRKVTAIKEPYDEFFADVVAVLYSGKADAISKSIVFTRGLQASRLKGQATQTLEQRDFENRRHQNLDTRPHNFFSATRSAIWNSYLASPSLRNKHSGEILEAVMDAITKEISFKLKNPDVSFQKNWELLNSRLIEAIDQQMASRGIAKIK
ncbi:hypothetical protein [Bdellovibrio sp. HCB274]|uniref:hypothetical protein n=1 Tax=Bdellovibrio sp. HCB274 TaxID=3394361 RepID=UPI0039B6D4EC